MGNAYGVAEKFLTAFAEGDNSALEASLVENVVLRIFGASELEARSGRVRVLAWLQEVRAKRPDLEVETLQVIAGADSTAVELRLQATEDGRYVERHWAAFLKSQDGLIESIDLYSPAPLPSARRGGWIAPADLGAEGVRRLFADAPYQFDVRQALPPDMVGRLSLERLRTEQGDHVSDNMVLGVRWRAEEADARIAAVIDHFLARNAGLRWLVGPFDTPDDLGERLEAHGFVYAGDQAIMARVGLDDVDITPNAEAEIELVDGSDEETALATMLIIARCFNWTEEQIRARSAHYPSRMRADSESGRMRTYLARLGGEPAATARLSLNGPVAHLAGAATLPEYRGRGLYATLLWQRLRDAQEAGYEIATIDAQPMSRPIVARYGFETYGRTRIYGWMPEMDENVIRSLLPT